MTQKRYTLDELLEKITIVRNDDGEFNVIDNRFKVYSAMISLSNENIYVVAGRPRNPWPWIMSGRVPWKLYDGYYMTIVDPDSWNTANYADWPAPNRFSKSESRRLFKYMKQKYKSQVLKE